MRSSTSSRAQHGGDAEPDETPTMLDEPEVTVVRRKSVGNLVSVSDDQLRPGLRSLQDKSHDEIRLDQPVVRPMRDPSKMEVQHLVIVNRQDLDCHRCATEPENLANGAPRLGEMHIEYLVEMVPPFSFTEKHCGLERL